MRIASLTKQFVAIATLQLAERGAIALDDPVLKHLPELGAVGDGVTIRHLLNHTAGLPHHSLLFMNEGRVAIDEENNDWLFAPLGSRTDDYMPTNEDVIALLREFPQKRFPPGAKWEYSNAGYIVLAQMIEAATGTPFRDYARDKLFEPLGMRDSGVFDESRPDPPRRAKSYLVGPDGFEERDYSPFNLLHGDGGIYSTLDDLAKWRCAFEPGVLLTTKTLSVIGEPARLDNGERVTDTLRGEGYSMGWFLDTIAGTPIWIHGGGWAAFRHAIAYAPGAGVWAIVLTNRSDTAPYEMAAHLLETALTDAASPEDRAANPAMACPARRNSR